MMIELVEWERLVCFVCPIKMLTFRQLYTVKPH